MFRQLITSLKNVSSSLLAGGTKYVLNSFNKALSGMSRETEYCKLTLWTTCRTSTDSCSYKLVAVFVNTPTLANGWVALLRYITTIWATNWHENCSGLVIYKPTTSAQKVHLATRQISCKEKFKKRKKLLKFGETYRRYIYRQSVEIHQSHLSLYTKGWYKPTRKSCTLLTF